MELEENVLTRHCVSCLKLFAKSFLLPDECLCYRMRLTAIIMYSFVESMSPTFSFTFYDIIMIETSVFHLINHRFNVCCLVMYNEELLVQSSCIQWQHYIKMLHPCEYLSVLMVSFGATDITQSSLSQKTLSLFWKLYL